MQETDLSRRERVCDLISRMGVNELLREIANECHERAERLDGEDSHRWGRFGLVIDNAVTQIHEIGGEYDPHWD